MSLNSFTAQGYITNLSEKQAPSGATRQTIELEIDTSYFDKQNNKHVEKISIFKMRRYYKPGSQEIKLWDYVVIKGGIVSSTNHETGESYPAFIAEYVLVTDHEREEENEFESC